MEGICSQGVVILSIKSDPHEVEDKYLFLEEDNLSSMWIKTVYLFLSINDASIA